jgi:hypothetical protein
MFLDPLPGNFSVRIDPHRGRIVLRLVDQEGVGMCVHCDRSTVLALIAEMQYAVHSLRSRKEIGLPSIPMTRVAGGPGPLEDEAYARLHRSTGNGKADRGKGRPRPASRYG